MAKIISLYPNQTFGPGRSIKVNPLNSGMKFAKSAAGLTLSIRIGQSTGRARILTHNKAETGQLSNPVFKSNLIADSLISVQLTVLEGTAVHRPCS